MAEKNSLWKNIRNKAKQNRKTGAKPKKPTAEMLRQERKIKAQKADGGPVSDDSILYRTPSIPMESYEPELENNFDFRTSLKRPASNQINLHFPEYHGRNSTALDFNPYLTKINPEPNVDVYYGGADVDLNLLNKNNNRLDLRGGLGAGIVKHPGGIEYINPQPSVGLSFRRRFAEGGQYLTVNGEYHRVYRNADGDIAVNHPKEDKGKWDTINLTDKSGANTIAEGVASVRKWHRENPSYAQGGYMYPDGGGINPGKQKAVASTTDVSVRALPEGLFEQIKANPPARQPQTISVVDKRKQNPITKKPINPNRDLVGGQFEDTVPIEIIKSSYKHGVDPATALSVGLLESRMGTTDPNVGHIMVDPYSDYMPGAEDMVLMIKEKQDYAKKLGYTDPLLQLQAYNGLGVLSNKRGEIGKSAYGLPIPKEGIDLRKNPLYGKKVKNVRDSVIMQSPDLVRLMDYYKPKMDGGYMYYEGGPMYYARGGFLEGLEDAGKLLVNTIASPIEQISGNNFVNWNYNNKWASDAAAVSEGIIGAATDVAGSVLLPGVYGQAKGAIQGITKNIGKSTEYQRGANKWANTTGQIASSAGDLTAGIMSGDAKQIVSGSGQLLNTIGGETGSKELSMLGQAAGIGSMFINPAKATSTTSSLPVDSSIQNFNPTNNIVNQGLSFAANGGPVNNNLLTLQTGSMRKNINSYRRKYKEGGQVDVNDKLAQFGLRKIQNGGRHWQNPKDGVIVGNASVEEDEVLKFAEGGSANLSNAEYVYPDTVNDEFTLPMYKPNESLTDFELDKDGNPIALDMTPAEFLIKEGTKGSPFRKINTLAKIRMNNAEAITRKARDLGMAINEQNQQNQQMMVGGALQYAAAGGKLNKDLERILSDDIQSYVEADNYYAYGGYLPKDKGFNMPNSYAKGGSIHIKKSKRGTFTAEAKKRGKSVQEFARQVLANKGNYSAAMVKKANFARNAAGWKHAEGGNITPDNPGFNALPEYVQAKIMSNMAMGGPLYGNTDSEYTYAHGGPVVSNVNQGFGLYAQNRGGMMMAQGGMMQQQGGQDQMMQIVQQVGQMLVQGAQPEQVMQQLVESGIPEEQALQVVQIAMQDLQGQMQQQEQEQMMPQEMAHGGYIQYAKGGETGGIPVKLTPTQEHFANEMYNRYGKVVLTDKATNETIYGTKKQDGTWDLNKFEVLTGVNSLGQSDTGYSVDQIDALTGKEADKHKVTPLGVWSLIYDDDKYGMPGYSLGNSNVAYHVTYKGSDDPNRSALYNNNNLEDNYRSYGCINCERPSMQALLNFVGKNGVSTVIDSRITPEENLKYMVKNTPTGASKFQKPKAKPAAKPAATTSAYDSRFSAVPSNLQPGAVRPIPARPKTEQIKKQIVKQSSKQAPTKQVQQPTYMRPTTPNQMPDVRQSVQQPVMQVPSSGYRGVSIVDYLNSVGMDSSRENRAKLAKQYGIENYNYSAQDNLALLDKIRGNKPESSQYAMGGNMYAVGGPPYDLPGMADMNPSEYNSINTYLNNLNTPNFVDNQGNTSSILSRMTNRQLSNNQPLNNQTSPDGPTRRMIGIDEYGEPIYQNVNTVAAQPMQPAQPDVNYGDDYFLNRQSGVSMESYNPNNKVVNPTNTPQQQGQPETNLFNVRNFTNLSDQGVDYVQNRPVQPMQSRNLQQLPTDNTKPGLVNDVERYGFEGVDASGNPVSVNPNMADEYMGGWRPEGTTMPENPNMFNNVLNKVGKFATRDNLTSLAQMAGPLHQFFQKKPKPFNYNTASAKTVDPTEAIAIADAKLKQSENVADYNTRQNAPSSGSYLANARANALTFGNKRAITGAGIKQQYDLNNANILNQFEQYNTELENRAIEAHQQDMANWQEQRTNALYNAGANLAGINKDTNYREMYKNYIAPNIGTNNYEYVQNPDGTYTLVPRQGSNSTFQVTKPETGTPTTNPAAPAAPITLKEDATVPQKYTQSLAPGTFNQNDPEQVKGFQDWMDTYHPNWAKGKNLNKAGKGYGRFGPSTKSAYDNYMYEYYGLNPNINQFPI